MSDQLLEAIKRIQALRDEIHVPEVNEDDEEDARVDMDSEDYGRFMAYEHALDILQLLAHDITPAQGDAA